MEVRRRLRDGGPATSGIESQCDRHYTMPSRPSFSPTSCCATLGCVKGIPARLPAATIPHRLRECKRAGPHSAIVFHASRPRPTGGQLPLLRRRALSMSRYFHENPNCDGQWPLIPGWRITFPTWYTWYVIGAYACTASDMRRTSALLRAGRGSHERFVRAVVFGEPEARAIGVGGRLAPQHLQDLVSGRVERAVAQVEHLQLAGEVLHPKRSSSARAPAGSYADLRQASRHARRLPAAGAGSPESPGPRTARD